MAFLIASTNLVIELGIVLWILAGWRFVAANFLLGIVMIAYAYLLSYFFLSNAIARQGRDHARQLEDIELKHPAPEGLNWKQKLSSMTGWRVIGAKFLGEWKMAYENGL